MKNDNRIYNPKDEPTITDEEFNKKLRKSINGIKMIYSALQHHHEEICPIMVSDTLEPFLSELCEIEARYFNYNGFKEL